MIIFQINNSLLSWWSCGSPTSWNFLWQERHLLISQNRISIGFFPKWNTFIGMIFAFSSIVLIKSLGDVFPMNKLGVTFRSDMIKPVVDTLVPKRRHKKFRSMDFIGSIFSKMLTSLQVLWPFLTIGSSHKEKNDVTTANFGSQTFWCVGHRFHGTFPKFLENCTS